MTLSPDIEAALSKPDTKAGILQRAALACLYAHRDADQLPTSARFVYYELIQQGIIAKKPERTDGEAKGQRPDQPLIVALTEGSSRGVGLSMRPAPSRGGGTPQPSLVTSPTPWIWRASTAGAASRHP